MNKINSTYAEDIQREGVLCIKDFLDDVTLSQIRAEINPWLDNISFNGHLSSMIVGNNQWIEHLGLCSLTLLETILGDDLIAFAEDYYQEEVVLGQFQYQKKIFSEKKGLPTHLDQGKGLYFFFYLNEVNRETGATKFYKGSHLKTLKEENITRKGASNESYLLESEEMKDSALEANGGPGSLVIWDRRTWHTLPGYSKHGRELVMASLIPKSCSHDAKDNLFKSSFLSRLSPKQLSVCLVHTQKENHQSLMKLGGEVSDLDDYGINRFKLWIYYLRFILIKIFRIYR